MQPIIVWFAFAVLVSLASVAAIVIDGYQIASHH